MTIQYKAIPQFTSGIDGRIVTGIFAIHGNVDDGDDRTHPGLFDDFLVKGRSRVRFLWQHDASAPPIAAIHDIRELGRDELPAPVLAYAPTATGGVQVVREYLNTPRANEVLEGLISGAITEMSYGYDPTKFSFEEADKRIIRNVFKSDLYDISDVNWGMNPATLAAKRRRLAEHSEAVHATVREYIDRQKDVFALRGKEGRPLSGANRARIEADIDMLVNAKSSNDAAFDQAIEDLRALLVETEPQKSQARLTQDARQQWVETQRRLAKLGVLS